MLRQSSIVDEFNLSESQLGEVEQRIEEELGSASAELEDLDMLALAKHVIRLWREEGAVVDALRAEAGRRSRASVGGLVEYSRSFRGRLRRLMNVLH